MNKSITLFLVMLAGLAGGQAGPTGDPPTSRSDAAANALFQRLSREVAARSEYPDDLTAIGRNPMRVVFLVDSSQSTEKADYNEFVRKVFAGFLRMLGRAQSDAGVMDDDRDDIWLYPYQLTLITDPDKIVRGKRLKSGEHTVEEITRHIPNARFPRTGEKDRGHDSSGARRSLISELGLSTGARKTVIIQITPTSLNMDPDHPSNERRIQAIDARSGLLDGTGYAVYRDEGKSFPTDPPGKGVPPSDVFIWVYGPEHFEVPPGKEPPIVAPITELPVVPPPPPPVGLYAVLVAVGAAIAYIAYRFFVKFPVTIGNELRRVGTTSPIGIVTAGGAAAGESLVIPPEKRGPVGAGLKVGEVTVPFLFGGPQVSGSGGFSLYVNNTLKPQVPLDTKPTPAQFGMGDDRTDPVSLARR